MGLGEGIKERNKASNQHNTEAVFFFAIPPP